MFKVRPILVEVFTLKFTLKIEFSESVFSLLISQLYTANDDPVLAYVAFLQLGTSRAIGR